MRIFLRKSARYGVLVDNGKTVFLKKSGFFVDKIQVRKGMKETEVRSILMNREGIL